MSLRSLIYRRRPESLHRHKTYTWAYVHSLLRREKTEAIQSAVAPFPRPLLIPAIRRTRALCTRFKAATASSSITPANKYYSWPRPRKFKNLIQIQLQSSPRHISHRSHLLPCPPDPVSKSPTPTARACCAEGVDQRRRPPSRRVHPDQCWLRASARTARRAAGRRAISAR